MSGECTTTEGKTYDTVNGEANNLAKLNLVAKPSVRVNAQSIGDRELINGSITSDKLSADVLDQINAEAILGDGSVTAAKIANGAVTFAKLNQDVLDVIVRRNTVTSTVGSYLRYVSTDGITEEVAPEDAYGLKAVASGKSENTSTGTNSTLTVTHNIDLADSVIVRVSLHSMVGNGGSGNSNFPVHGTVVFRKSGGSWNHAGSYAMANGTSPGDAEVVQSTGTTATLPTLGGGAASVQQTVEIKDDEVDVVTTVSSDTGFQVTAVVEVL